MNAYLYATLIIISITSISSGFTTNCVLEKKNTFSLKLSSTVEPEIKNPRLEGLAFALDNGTRKSHSVAQNSAFVTGFFKGLSTEKAYGALLTSLYFVYTAMEESFDKTSDEAVKSLDDAELRRVDSLKKDLEYFYGFEWAEKLNTSQATQKYVKRIKEISQEKSYLLVAHQYTRYLGDLFGGQMMGGMATKSLNLSDGKGVAFYTFDDIPDANVFIIDWYNRLNRLDLSDAQKEEIIDEANHVFDLNIGILEELDGSAAGAFWSLVWNTFKEKIRLK